MKIFENLNGIELKAGFFDNNDNNDNNNNIDSIFKSSKCSSLSLRVFEVRM
jgi:hypothetical protein